MTKTTEMKRSSLVQRLREPRGGLVNAFSFGGGLRNGGLSDEAMALLSGIFSFDYMGSAEFELGAVAEAVQAIAKDSKHYAKGTVSVPLREVAADFRYKGPEPKVGETAMVYIICRKDEDPEVVKRILNWASKDPAYTKEATFLSSSLRPFREWDGDVKGWLELNNGFFFFTDQEMWQKTCDLFGIGGE